MYSFTQIDNNKYSFITDSNNTYFVNFKEVLGMTTLSFRIDGVPKTSEVFKTMSTIKDIFFVHIKYPYVSKEKKFLFLIDFIDSSNTNKVLNMDSRWIKKGLDLAGNGWECEICDVSTYDKDALSFLSRYGISKTAKMIIIKNNNI